MPAELCVSRGCINKIMMSHLTLHPKSGANYLCLYCLMTETRTGPLPPAGTQTGRSREAILCLWVCRLTEAICQAGIQAPSPRWAPHISWLSSSTHTRSLNEC